MDGPNIGVPRGVWKVPGEDLRTVVINFNLPYGFESGAFEAKVKPSNT